jgi:hypothetical protein
MGRLQSTLWEGVVLRRTRAAADPDSPRRAVALPGTWPEDAASALVALMGEGTSPVSLPRAAEAWIGRAAARGQRSGVLDGAEAATFLAEALRALLLMRRGAPGPAVWRGAASEPPRFVLALPAFLEPGGGFDAEGFAEACALGVRALDSLSSGKATRLALGYADLAGLLAGLGLAYGSVEAREVAAAVAALARGAAEAESGRIAARLGARRPVALLWPAPPAATVVPGLAAAARAALDAAAASPGLRHEALLALAPADAAEALLGAETAGIAPAPGATRPVLSEAGVVEVPSRAALRLGVPDRIARLLGSVTDTERNAMRDAVAPFLHVAPPLPAALPQSPRRMPPPATLAWHPPAPSSPASLVQATMHVVIGGHRAMLRRGTDQDGRLLEVGLTVARDTAPAPLRGLLEGLAAAVSIGLRQGVPLAEYVECFAHARIGPAGGAVEGDPDIRRAVSVMDWAFRRLAIDHLERRDLADPEDADVTPPRRAEAPMLPLDLPRQTLPGAVVRPAAPRRREVRLAG